MITFNSWNEVPEQFKTKDEIVNIGLCPDYTPPDAKLIQENTECLLYDITKYKIQKNGEQIYLSPVYIPKKLATFYELYSTGMTIKNGQQKSAYYQKDGMKIELYDIKKCLPLKEKAKEISKKMLALIVIDLLKFRNKFKEYSFKYSSFSRIREIAGELSIKVIGKAIYEGLAEVIRLNDYYYVQFDEYIIKVKKTNNHIIDYGLEKGMFTVCDTLKYKEGSFCNIHSTVNLNVFDEALKFLDRSYIDNFSRVEEVLGNEIGILHKDVDCINYQSEMTIVDLFKHFKSDALKITKSNIAESLYVINKVAKHMHNKKEYEQRDYLYNLKDVVIQKAKKDGLAKYEGIDISFKGSKVIITELYKINTYKVHSFRNDYKDKHEYPEMYKEDSIDCIKGFSRMKVIRALYTLNTYLETDYLTMEVKEDFVLH